MEFTKEELKKISEKSKIPENVILFYLKNKGYLEDIFNGIIINKENYFNPKEIMLSDNIKLKENIIENDILYNIAHYCVQNNFEYISLDNEEYFNINEDYNINKHILPNNILIHNQINCFSPPCNEKIKGNIYIYVEFDLDLIMPKGFYNEDFEKQEELEDYCYEELDLVNIDGEYYYYFRGDIKLTNDLNNNLIIIDNYIKNEYKVYLKKIEKIKIYTEKLFEVDILKSNINNF